jgi:hypothetical protein
MRVCYACDSKKTVQYQYPRARGVGISQLWYTNGPTNLVLCNRCYCCLIKNPVYVDLALPIHTYMNGLENRLIRTDTLSAKSSFFDNIHFSFFDQNREPKLLSYVREFNI